MADEEQPPVLTVKAIKRLTKMAPKLDEFEGAVWENGRWYWLAKDGKKYPCFSM